MLVLATVSELRMENASMLFLASANPNERGGELGTDGKGGERGASAVDMSDVAVVIGGGEGGTLGE